MVDQSRRPASPRRFSIKSCLRLALIVAHLSLIPQRVCGQGYPASEAVHKMTVADGLRVKLFASEPEVRQPSFVKCDDRGRLWTIQYLQYPNPAGLKRIQVDRWSRTLYDRVPKPPPHGPRGADKITILEDTDGDGSADVVKDFVDGLNLVTGVAFGHGGVYVLNVPYLLFYPDRDRDDVPDSDPQVMLTGFGMQDAQSSSNHLTWGPDGWLYGVNGSTTTCQIRGIEFQQGLWRFHPVTGDFELFCEGGSNCYGVTFDENGEVYYSTNGGPFVHAVQGGYFFKSFGKHGPLHNLYAYHFFPNLQCDQVPGGPPTGGTIYLGDSFPEIYRGKFVAGNFLGHTASWWSIEPQGSSVQAKFGAKLLDSHDTWFGPTDMCLGPDGSMYVADFHDQRTAHPDPDANWDRSNGRIYKIEGLQNKPLAPFDIRELSSDALVDLLSHRNHWFRDRARCELAYRQDKSVVTRLRAMAMQVEDSQLALQGLWSHYVTAGIDDDLADELLRNPAPYVRSWTVRLLADAGPVSAQVGGRLADLARSEDSPVVRAQLAASAKRIQGSTGLQIIRNLLEQAPAESDERIPWLIWWAIESRAISESDALVAMFRSTAMWDNAAAKQNAFRLVRRYAAEGTAAGYAACAKLLAAVPPGDQIGAHQSLRLGLAERAVRLANIDQGDLFQQQAAAVNPQAAKRSRQFEPLTAELREYIDQLWRQHPTDPLCLELAIRGGNDLAQQQLLDSAADINPADSAQLSQTLPLLAEFGRLDAAPIVLKLFSEAQADDSKLACLSALENWGSSEITETLLQQYDLVSPEVRRRIAELLLARPDSALEFLRLVDSGNIDPQQLSISQIRLVSIHQDSVLDTLVRKHWGNVGPGSAENKLATMRRFNNDLRAAPGNAARGQAVFAKHCAVCHQFRGIGNQVGPDLTSANRGDRIALLANLVDPSAVVRREYISYVAETTSGRVLTGLLAEQDAASVTILDAQNNRTRLSRSEVEQLVPSQVSLMPEGILEQLTPQQLRDLFSYLQE